MATAHSRITAQGQISVPAGIRKKLGVGPGSILEWEECGDGVLVRRGGRYSSVDVHEAVFPRGTPEAKTAAEIKQGICAHMRKRHARD